MYTNTTAGFDRNTEYAIYIRNVVMGPNDNAFTLPANFDNHVVLIVGAIYTHLRPILSLRLDKPEKFKDALLAKLHTLVTIAGILSLSMRMDVHTVYHIEPVFKEDTFTSKRMLCLNRTEMEQTNPLTADTEEGLSEAELLRRSCIPAAEKARARGDIPLTQIVVMDGITAYRRGGWETPGSTITNLEFEKPEFASRGIRSRKLTQGWVYCRWGRERKHTLGKPADVAAHHSFAWREGGFINFSQVPDVVNWEELDRDSRVGSRKTATPNKEGENVDVETADETPDESPTTGKAKSKAARVNRWKGRAEVRAPEAGSPVNKRGRPTKLSEETFETYSSPLKANRFSTVTELIAHHRCEGAKSRPWQDLPDEQDLQDQLAAESSE
jgi:hypothetical protein